MAILTVGAHGSAADRVVHYAAFVPYRPLLGSSMFNQFSRRSRAAVVAKPDRSQSNDGQFSHPRAPLAVHELCSQQHAISLPYVRVRRRVVFDARLGSSKKSHNGRQRRARQQGLSTVAVLGSCSRP